MDSLTPPTDTSTTFQVIAVLNKDCNAHDENVDVWASKLSLSRLKLAIKYEQKAVGPQTVTSTHQPGQPKCFASVCLTSSLSTTTHFNLVRRFPRTTTEGVCMEYHRLHCADHTLACTCHLLYIGEYPAVIK